ncbi:phosphotransferase [Grouper iridovirus]|uniref:Phosphotransferase n=1 Tax=Grouper iridovirus TaxID=127569 RepID=Q5GAD3_9VIRU|nr:phosphotransferase [Grouper iridovirus]
MLTNVEYFDGDKQGKQGKSGFCMWRTEPVFFKISNDPDMTCELDAAVARKLWGLNKIHYCKPLCTVDVNGKCAMVSERLEGVALQDYMLNRIDKNYTVDPVKIETYLSVLSQTMAGLTVAHLVDVCHADLHTRNVMMCPTEHKYFVYSLGGDEMLCVPTMGFKAVLIDFGMATLPGSQTYTDDQLASVGLTPNGTSDHAADVRNLSLSVFFDLMKACARCSDETVTRQGHETLVAFRNVMAGMPEPLNSSGWFGRQFPSLDDAIAEGVPECFKWKVHPMWYVKAANLCKVLVPRPYERRAYTDFQVRGIWSDLMKELELQKPKEFYPNCTRHQLTNAMALLKAVAVKEHIPKRSLAKAIVNLGLLTAAYTAECYKVIDQIKLRHTKRLRWIDALDVWCRLPSVTSGPLPETGTKVLVQDLIRNETMETVVSAEMLVQITATRSALEAAQSAENSLWFENAPYGKTEKMRILEMQEATGMAFAKEIASRGLRGEITERANHFIKLYKQK